MHKVLAVALREYRAAVHTRAFLVSLLLMPIIVAVSTGAQVLAAKADAETTKTYAIVDRTGQLRAGIEAAKERHNSVDAFNPETGAREAQMFALEFVEPSADVRDAILAQRYELSLRHLRGEIEGILEIGPDVLEIAPQAAVTDERSVARFQSEKAAEMHFARWANRAVNSAVQEVRLARRGISREAIREAQTPVQQRVKGMTRKNPTTGALEDASDESRVVSFVLPLALVSLMMTMVLLGALPAMQGVVEEKQQRIAEVLLGCVTPFQLMLGKLFGVLAVSLTISGVYLTGGGVVLGRFAALGLLPPSLIAWFVVFLVLAILLYGSLFMAIGAAATDLKETQSLQMPVVFLVMMPALMLGAVLRDPTGKAALIGSFVPFSAPMLMTARLSMGAGVPWWQPPLATIATLAAALGCVWIASRIFRVGLLSQGKTPGLRDLVRWVVSG